MFINLSTSELQHSGDLPGDPAWFKENIALKLVLNFPNLKAL
jgi:hypothetical protein